MAESQRQEVIDLVPSIYDPNVYIYDPDPRARYHKRPRRRAAYDPRRYAVRKRRHYDPAAKRRNGNGNPMKGKMAKLKSMLNYFAPPLLGVVAFFGAITAGDQAAAANFLNGQNTQNKIRFVFASAMYRLTGGFWNPAPDVYGGQFLAQKGWTWNWTKAFNWITWVGLAGTLYGWISPAGPMRSFARKTGPLVFFAALFGGGLDPSPPGSPGVLTSSAPARAGATPLVTAYSTGGRSSTGGAVAAPASNAIGTLA